MSRPLFLDVSEVAATQIRTAEAWWRANRPKAPNAVREELERAFGLIAIQPSIGSLARNSTLPGVRRLHLARIRYDLYYQLTTAGDRVHILGFWHSSRGIGPLF